MLLRLLGHRPGQLMKFTVGPGGIQLRDGYPVGADLQFQGFMKADRHADFWSKVSALPPPFSSVCEGHCSQAVTAVIGNPSLTLHGVQVKMALVVQCTTCRSARTKTHTILRCTLQCLNVMMLAAGSPPPLKKRRALDGAWPGFLHAHSLW